MPANKVLVVASLTCIFLLTACGGDGAKPVADAETAPAGDPSTNEPPISQNPESGNLPPGTGTGNAGVAAIAGFWDRSKTGPAGTDIGHIQIEPDGSVTVYDFQGDAADAGPDCAIIGTGTVTNTSADIYRFVVMTGTETVTDTGQASVIAGRLETKFIDSRDEDSDGDTTETITESYPSASNVPQPYLTACPA